MAEENLEKLTKAQLIEKVNELSKKLDADLVKEVSELTKINKYLSEENEELKHEVFALSERLSKTERETSDGSLVLVKHGKKELKVTVPAFRDPRNGKVVKANELEEHPELVAHLVKIQSGILTAHVSQNAPQEGEE